MTVARVIGSADCQPGDLERLGALVGGAWPGLTVAVNEAGVHFPGHIDAWASLHADKFLEEVDGEGDWLRRREQAGHSAPGCVCGHLRVQSPVALWRQTWPGGSSGIYGVDVALHVLGARRVVLCGIPLDNRVHLYRGEPWTEARGHRLTWERALHELRPRVRSMSGWTQELLGAPDREWLAP